MIDLERYLGSYLGMLVHSFNPDRYVGLLEESWHRFLKFFLWTLGVACALFLLTFLPLAFHYVGSLPETLHAVDAFEVSASVNATQPVVILGSPEIVLDLERQGRDGATVLFTREGIYYPRFVLFGDTFLRWDDLANMKEPTAERDRLLIGIVIFLLPSIMFWFALVSVLKLLLAFVVLLIIGVYGPRFFRRRMRFPEVVKLAVLTMPSVTLIGVGLSPLAPTPLFLWGFLLTFVLFAIGLALLSERAAHPRAKYK